MEQGNAAVFWAIFRHMVMAVSQFSMLSRAPPVAVKMEEVGNRAMDRNKALALSC